MYLNTNSNMGWYLFSEDKSKVERDNEEQVINHKHHPSCHCRRRGAIAASLFRCCCLLFVAAAAFSTPPPLQPCCHHHCLLIAAASLAVFAVAPLLPPLPLLTLNGRRGAATAFSLPLPLPSCCRRLPCRLHHGAASAAPPSHRHS